MLLRNALPTALAIPPPDVAAFIPLTIELTMSAPTLAKAFTRAAAMLLPNSSKSMGTRMFTSFITSPGKLAKVLARSGMFLLNHVLIELKTASTGAAMLSLAHLVNSEASLFSPLNSLGDIGGQGGSVV